MEDLSGTATHTHRIIHGEALSAWIRTLVQSTVSDQGSKAMMTLRDAVGTHLGMHTLHMIALCLSDNLPAVSSAPQPPAPASVVNATNEAPTPRPIRPVVIPPGVVSRSSSSTSAAGRIPPEAASSSTSWPETEGDVAGMILPETWSSMPTRSPRGKAVNVMEVMKQGDKQRHQDSLRISTPLSR